MDVDEDERRASCLFHSSPTCDCGDTSEVSAVEVDQGNETIVSVGFPLNRLPGAGQAASSLFNSQSSASSQSLLTHLTKLLQESGSAPAKQVHLSLQMTDASETHPHRQLTGECTRCHDALLQLWLFSTDFDITCSAFVLAGAAQHPKLLIQTAGQQVR